ncbi:MAG: wax ester/triacylglycerol synthase family O-acyltransferase [Xanthomonadales bacterium]|nr:wax ester/triacylglycerol synthase family O-acyltransferase [Xanthomonadales bacterium]
MPKLALLDQGFLLLESANSPRHVAGLQLYQCPSRTRADFVSRLVEEFRQQPPVPPFNWKLRAPVITPPSWIEDADFDIDNHLFHQALPAPGSMEQLRRHVARLHARLLDRSRPLWEVHIFEGLGPGQFAVYTKIHHAYMDGVTMSRLTMASLATNPRDRSKPALWANTQRSQRAREERKKVSASLFGTARSLGRQVLLGPRVMKMFIQRGVAQAFGDRGLVLPFSAPRTLFNERLTAARAVGFSTLLLADVKRLARDRNVTVNDVILTVCDIAMRDYLEESGKAPEQPLVAEMPVSLRAKDDNSDAGNHLAIVLLEMAADESDPLDRLSQVQQNAERAKTDAHQVAPEAAEAYTLLTQTAATLGDLAGVSQHIRPLGNVVISNLIGDHHPHYLRQAKMECLYPISTIAPNTALNITIYTQDGKMHFGLLAGKTAVTDPQHIADGIVEAFEALKARAAQVARSAVKKKKARVARKKASKKTRSR